MRMSRPAVASAFCIAMLVCALVMGWIGSMAAGYFVCILALLLEAALLWTGRAKTVFKLVLLVNQASGLALVLVLWLGAPLGDLKLDISGVSLLVNLAFGGPLLAALALPLILLMRFGATLPAWFARRAA